MVICKAIASAAHELAHLEGGARLGRWFASDGGGSVRRGATGGRSFTQDAQGLPADPVG